MLLSLMVSESHIWRELCLAPFHPATNRPLQVPPLAVSPPHYHLLRKLPLPSRPAQQLRLIRRNRGSRRLQLPWRDLRDGHQTERRKAAEVGAARVAEREPKLIAPRGQWQRVVRLGLKVKKGLCVGVVGGVGVRVDDRGWYGGRQEGGVGLIWGREKEERLKVHFFCEIEFECNLRVAAFKTKNFLPL